MSNNDLNLWSKGVVIKNINCCTVKIKIQNIKEKQKPFSLHRSNFLSKHSMWPWKILPIIAILTTRMKVYM